jgi:hypothetical protein
MLDILALEHLARIAKFHLRAMRTAARDSCDFVTRKRALCQNLHDFAPNIASRPDYGHPVTHDYSPISKISTRHSVIARARKHSLAFTR